MTGEGVEGSYVRYQTLSVLGFSLTKSQPQASRMLGFLSLPREIRDIIYDSCFVREKIEFEEFFTDETPEEWVQDRRLESLTLHLAKPNEKPLLEYNGAAFVHRVERLTPIDGRSHWDDVLYMDRQRSYRIFRGTVDPPCLRIFLTNSFVYKEAASVFYGKNVFTFPSKGCEVTLNACSAFLRDRPEHALPYIKNIHLTIGHYHSLSRRISEWGLYYGAHQPTVKHLGEVLRRKVHLNYFRLLVEEQNPTHEMLRTFKSSLGYARIPHWYEAFRGIINVSKTFDIEFTDSSGTDTHKVWMYSMIRSVIGDSKPDNLTYISSSPNIRNEEGKEMFSTRVVYHHLRKAESSGLFSDIDSVSSRFFSDSQCDGND